VVVVRYFGGTKLGKGGLIRAYGGTAGLLLADAPFVMCQETTPLFITLAYNLQGVVEGVLRRFDLTPNNAVFEETVRLEVSVQPDRCQDLIDAIAEVTAGRAVLTRMPNDKA
jgi:putative IMPACT (imprinted ancient) family translation regulator